MPTEDHTMKSHGRDPGRSAGPRAPAVDPELEKPDPPPVPQTNVYQQTRPEQVATLPNGLKVDHVDGGPIRQSGAYDFMLGGHDNFYKFMPKDTIAIERTSSPQDQKFVLLHELIERQLMQKKDVGKYQEAHHIANKVERAVRKDPARMAEVKLTPDGAVMPGMTGEQKLKVASALVPDLLVQTTFHLHELLKRAEEAAGSPSQEVDHPNVSHLIGGIQSGDLAPGLLVDLDGTVRETEGQPCPYGLGEQRIRPNVLTILRDLRDHGFRVIGVTNHTTQWPGEEKSVDPDQLRAIQHETMDLCGGLLDDIVYSQVHDAETMKPRPVMLEHAIRHWRIDPERSVMVGNSDDDRLSADAAGIPFSHADQFFGDPETTVHQVTTLLGMTKKADAVQVKPQNEYLLFNPEGQVAVKPSGFRRYDLPREGQGKKAPYEHPLRWIPPEGVPEPGIHGYDIQMNVGETAEAPQGYQWHDPKGVLKQLYGAMGRRENAPYRELDRVHARVLLRMLKRRSRGAAQAPAQQVVQQAPVAP